LVIDNQTMMIDSKPAQVEFFYCMTPTKTDLTWAGATKCPQFLSFPGQNFNNCTFLVLKNK